MKISICIPTYQRNDDLARLIGQLQAQDGLSESADIDILIVDNNPDGRAREVAEHFAGAPVRFAVNYVHETRPGVSHARNRALDTCRASDLVAFIDDDELPAARWLAELVAMRQQTGADAVFGSVEAAYPPGTPHWMVRGNYHAILIDRDGPREKPGISGNCLIDRARVDQLDLRFDPRLTLVGGEDTLFFDTLLQAGARFADASRAVTYEQVPEARARLDWLRKRWRRTGLTDALVKAQRRGGGPSAQWLAGFDGFLRVVTGGPLAAFSWLIGGTRMSKRVAGFLFTFERGLGMIEFARGRMIEEYSRPAGA